jgi:hypothetical protein
VIGPRWSILGLERQCRVLLRYMQAQYYSVWYVLCSNVQHTPYSITALQTWHAPAGRAFLFRRCLDGEESPPAASDVCPSWVRTEYPWKGGSTEYSVFLLPTERDPDRTNQNLRPDIFCGRLG